MRLSLATHLIVLPIVTAVALASIGCGGAAAAEPPRSGGATTTTAATRPTEPFRKEHVELSEHLRHVYEMNGKLPSQPSAEQAQTMKHIVGFFEEHLAPHAKWEENHLYNSVDKRAGAGPNAFTASMRFEHRVVERWIGELRKESQSPKPDVSVFSRRTDYLLGLVTAHFEAEEEVLLPVLDRTMTAEEFERELGSHH